MEWIDDWLYNMEFFNIKDFPALAKGWEGKYYYNIYLEFFYY